jgi:outer membrane receptor for ferrienterochelin and colicins
MKTLFLTSILALLFHTSSAQVNAQLSVAGNCDMCKKRIETAVDIKGVKQGTWDKNTHILSLNYTPQKVSLEQIAEELSKAGHDNSIYRADSAAYSKLHDCCHYERIQPDTKRK